MPDTYAEVEAYADPNQQHWDKGGKGILKSSFNNCMNFLEADPELAALFKHNLHSDRIELCRRPDFYDYIPLPKILDDEDLVRVKDYLRKKRFEPSVCMLDEAIKAAAYRCKYHPVMDYLNSLTWDQTPRLDNWLTEYCGAPDDIYTRWVGKMTLVAACARVDKPGIKYDHMLILKGPQGTGKSEIVKTLGGEWFTELSLVDKDKDTVARMLGQWIIEIPEMDCQNRKDTASMRSFLTTEKDNARLSYARHPKKYARQSIFIGTFNPSGQSLLKDDSGDRRFFPIMTNKLKVGAFKRDRDQIWAEAYKAYKGKFPLYLKDHAVVRMAKERQEDDFQMDDWEPLIKEWVNNVTIGINKFQLRGIDVWTSCFDGKEKDFERKYQTRISSVLHRLGYERKSFTRDNESIKGYVLKTDSVNFQE